MSAFLRYNPLKQPFSKERQQLELSWSYSQIAWQPIRNQRIKELLITSNASTRRSVYTPFDLTLFDSVHLALRAWKQVGKLSITNCWRMSSSLNRRFKLRDMIMLSSSRSGNLFFPIKICKRTERSNYATFSKQTRYSQNATVSHSTKFRRRCRAARSRRIAKMTIKLPRSKSFDSRIPVCFDYRAEVNVNEKLKSACDANMRLDRQRYVCDQPKKTR
ncbi:hypothetical protein RF11_12864 [Thelohanellus kitauei]|uniref:Uncharacterized protein n=1 Tax=Thelohanellus kitauei TaxID=669202 RepID=A0A0C2MAT3_THEKT|nr:hypothetical protein RF11_12864 [Thelohanellus kitauei]